MPQRNVDDRSKKIVFVSNCLLNANNKVQEFARYPGMFTEVVRTLDKYGVGIMQMPCPEVLHIGCQRWWHSRNLYDNAGFRHCCRKLAEQMVDYMENYAIVGYDVVAVLEELLKAIEARGLPAPPMYGLLMDDREKTNEQIIAEFDAFIRTRLGA